MKDETEQQAEDYSPMEETYSPPSRRNGSKKKGKLFGALLLILLLVVFAGGLIYFVSKRMPGKDLAQQSKLDAFEQKMAGLERQIVELQGKAGTPGTDPALVQRLDALAQRVEVLEKSPKPIVESKSKSAPPKAEKPTPKQYHRVEKGETLTRISKKYGTSVEELRKLNHLSPGQSIKVGQKLFLPPAP